MERSSCLYKLRRKMQIIAHSIFPNAFMVKIYSWIVLKENINLENPKTFNEKIQWLKLYEYPFNELVIVGADKYAVREYVSEKGLDNILVPLLGVWENANDIEWSQLPKEFMLKCNHGCAYNIPCVNKKLLDIQLVTRQLNQWLKEDFGAFNIELHYSKIKKRLIICEEYLGEKITDYKFFCFHGTPHFVYVSKDLIHDRRAQMGFFDLNGNKIPLIRTDYADIGNIIFPPFFNEMQRIARILSEDFIFVRVDFFVLEDRFYFSELTFTPGAGMMPFDPKQYDLEWGDLIKLDGVDPFKKRR